MAVYTTIDNPEAYFRCITYTATTAEAYTDSSFSFQPDLIWLKNRDATYPHHLFDAVRGRDKGLSTNSADEEQDRDTGYLTSFDDDGFTLGTSIASDTSDGVGVWCWKANGTGSANTAGSINTAATSANTTSGFSICTVADIGSEDFTFGHGLGVAPSWVLAKSRDGGKWNNYFKSLGAGYTIQLPDAAAKITNDVMWQDTDPSSTLVSSNGDQLDSNESYVFYCFADVQGFSKFSSYTGNGNADGPMIYTGFKPAFVIIKASGFGGTDWQMYDNKRNTYNATNNYLRPNLTNAEASGDDIDFLSQGIKIRTSSGVINNNGYENIYMAFAEAPFVNSNGVPGNAR